MVKRRKSRSGSSTLLTTFLFGFCIGSSFIYALVVSLEIDFSGVEKEVSGESSNGVRASLARGVDGGLSAGEIEEKSPETSGSVASTILEEVDSEETLYADVEGVWPGRHLFVTVPGTVLDDATRELLSVYKPGGVVLRSENLVDESQTRRLVDDIKDAVGLGTGYADAPFITVSLEEIAESDFGLEEMPSAWELGAGGDADRVGAVARRYAVSARKRGIGVVLGPSLDVYRPRMGNFGPKERFFGGDVGVVASVGLAFAEGLRASGVLPVVGHYPGLGAATQGADGSLAILDDQKTLAEEVIFPFARAADGNVAGLLVGHIAVPVLDEDTPERPASLSPKLVQTLLREVWFYEGLVLADDVTLHPAVSGRSADEIVVEALLAGCDAVLLYALDRDKLNAICRAVVERSAVNSVFRERLSASKARLSNHLAMLAAPVPQPAGTERVLHAVRRGENLIAIARQYRVYVDDVMAWNGLNSSEIRFGQRLSIYVPRAGTGFAATLDSERTEPAEPEDVLAQGAREPGVIPETEVPGWEEEELEEAGEVTDGGDGAFAGGVVDDEALETEMSTAVSGGDEVVAEADGAQTGDDLGVEEDSLEEIVTASDGDEVVAEADGAQAGVELGFEEDSLEEMVPALGGDETVADADGAQTDVDLGVEEDSPEEMVPTSGGDEVVAKVDRAGEVTVDLEESADSNPVDSSIETVEPVGEDGAVGVGGSDLVEGSEGADSEELEASVPASTSVATIKGEHVVAEGETVAGIALAYGVTEEVLRSWNEIEGELLDVGSSLVVYLPAEANVEEEKAFGYYTIQRGDILHNVALKLGTTKVMLMELNGLLDSNLIKIGQRLKYPLPSE